MVKLSILGLTQWTDGHVWDQFETPEEISRQDAIDAILMECAELALVYTDPDTVAGMIGLWCRKQMENWKHIAQALLEEYNPLHNYDRHEEWTDKGQTQVAGFNQAADMADKDAAESDHKGHIYGNIGVTTSAQMIAGEMDVRLRYNVLDAIVGSFKDQFCVQVY